MKLDMSGVRSELKKIIKAAILEHSKECRNKIANLERYDEVNKYGYVKSSKNLVSLSEVLKIIEEI